MRGSLAVPEASPNSAVQLGPVTAVLQEPADPLSIRAASRELATDFRNPDTGQPYNPDFAALARSCGVEGVRIDRAGDLGDASAANPNGLIGASGRIGQKHQIAVMMDNSPRTTAMISGSLPTMPIAKPEPHASFGAAPPDGRDG